MALALFETQEQSLDRERRKFRTHVDSEVQRFERAQEEMQSRRAREEEDAERERQQGIAFQRQRFTELVTPTLDEYANDFNAERDRVDGEHSKFRDAIMPTLDQERQRLERVRGERTKFAETVGPSLSALGSVGGGFDAAGGQPAPRFDTGGGEATATAQGRGAALGRALNEEVPGFFFNYKNRQAFGSDRGDIPEGVRLPGEVSPAQAVKLAQRLDAGEFGDPSWPDNVGLRQALQEIVERGAREKIGGGVVGDALGDVVGALGDQPALGGFPAQLAGVGGPSVSDVVSPVAERAGRVLKSEELLAGRVWEQVKVDVRRGPGFLRTPDTSQISQMPNDHLVALRAVIGGEEDEAALDRELTEIGLDSRILGPVFVSPATYLPLEKMGFFIRGLGKLKFGRGIEDDAARFTVDVLKRADVSAPAFSQVETAADISGRVGADITPRMADVLATGATDVSGRVGADFAPRVADVPLATADIAAPRTGDVTALGSLGGPDVTRAGTAVTRAGTRAGPGTFPGPDDLREGDITSPIPAPDVPPVASSWEDAVDTLTAAIEGQRLNIRGTTVAQSAEQAARLGRSEDIYRQALKEGKSNSEALRLQQASRRGKLSQADQIVVEIPEAQRQALWDRVDAFDFGRGVDKPDMERVRVRSVLEALQGGREGVPIQENELISLEKVLGRKVADAIRTTLRKGEEGVWHTVYEIATMPKAILSSFDLSYPLRQGIMAAPGHPFEFAKSFGPMVRAGASEKVSKEIYQQIINNPRVIRFADGTSLELGQIKRETGLLRTLDPGLSTSEEHFRSALAEKLTKWLGNFVRRSNRSFTTFGNKFRSDMFDTVVRGWERDGVGITPERVQGLSNMLNRFTGRGTLGKGRGAQGFTEAMQVAWWSPQYRAAGPQAFAQLLNSDRAIRAEAWRNMATFVTTGMSLLGAAKLSGLGDVTLDPRSTDFGKMRFGNTRINIWGTNATLIRTIVQALSGQTLSENLGVTQRGEPIIPGILSPRGAPGARYARSGLAPEWGLVVDWFDGKTFLGENLGYDTESAWKIAKRNLIPLVGQDAWEAFDEAGWWGLATVPYAFFGGGVQAYGGDPSSQLRSMPKWEGVDIKLERDIRDFRKEVQLEHNSEQRLFQLGQGPEPGPLADLAITMGNNTGRAELGTRLAQSERGDLPLSEATIAFVMENQDALSDEDLQWNIPESLARYLSDENWARWNKATVEGR